MSIWALAGARSSFHSRPDRVSEDSPRKASSRERAVPWGRRRALASAAISSTVTTVDAGLSASPAINAANALCGVPSANRLFTSLPALPAALCDKD